MGDHSSLVTTLGGVALFILGMSMASENLQKIAADRIRDIVTTLAKKPFWGLGLGVGLTMILQSSGAVTSLLVGLGSAGVIGTQQVMSVILGSAIGSSLVVQVLSFDILRFGLPFFAISFFVFWFSKRRIVKTCAAAAMGFGLLFYGLEVIRLGTEELRNVEIFQTFIKALSATPLYTVLLTAFFTALVASSAVTISIGMLLTLHGIITLEDAMYWIFGANIGTTATALIASAGGNYVGRQVAWAHTFYKVASVALFIPFSPYIAEFFSSGQPTRDVANINTAFNLAAALIFYPFLGYGARLIERLFPPSPHEMQFSVKYLNKKDWESPSVVLAHAEREALRMADIVTSMIEDSLKMFRTDDPELVENMRRRDDRADLLARELNLYLAQQIDQAPDGIREQMLKLMYFVTDLEAAADVVDNQLLELAQKKHHFKVDFSEDGWRELNELSSAVGQIAHMAIACFQTQDKDLAAKVIFHKRNIRRLEQKMRESHMTRLVKGTPESIRTSSIHLDVLGEYRRIVGLLSNHVYSLLKDSDPYGLLPRRE
ncbi:MAG: Na/Pi cotransporter family protein [Bdellovibrionales bacterium]|nr:Na/Pi cotransporter family protein [Bdellovibrionales bacterium]